MSHVYFSPIITSSSAQDLLVKLITEDNITLNKELPLKIHPGAIGNTAYIKPDLYSKIISYLQSTSINPYFIETCMASETSRGKEEEFKAHGFTQIPHVIADGPEGDEQQIISLTNGHIFKSCLIAKKLAESPQVLVITHFKGHGMAGFGGAIKMLGIGFASGQGKTIIHSLSNEYTPGQKIDWDHAVKSNKSDEFHIHDWDPTIVSEGQQFRYRFAEYAAAATLGKKHLYLTFAMNFSPDCDCNGKEMAPLYPDLGIFASTDPVAIDRAVFDMLATREGRAPFAGREIFEYAKSLGIGSISYQLITPLTPDRF